MRGQSRGRLTETDKIHSLQNILAYISNRLKVIDEKYGYNAGSYGEHQAEFESLGEILYKFEPYKNDPIIGSLENNVYVQFATMRNNNRYYQLQSALYKLHSAGVVKAFGHDEDYIRISRKTRY